MMSYESAGRIPCLLCVARISLPEVFVTNYDVSISLRGWIQGISRKCYIEILLPKSGYKNGDCVILAENFELIDPL